MRRNDGRVERVSLLNPRREHLIEAGIECTVGRRRRVCAESQTCNLRAAWRDAQLIVRGGFCSDRVLADRVALSLDDEIVDAVLDAGTEIRYSKDARRIGLVLGE